MFFIFARCTLRSSRSRCRRSIRIWLHWVTRRMSQSETSVALSCHYWKATLFWLNTSWLCCHTRNLRRGELSKYHILTTLLLMIQAFEILMPASLKDCKVFLFRVKGPFDPVTQHNLLSSCRNSCYL